MTARSMRQTFNRTLVEAATIRPFLRALLELRRARVEPAVPATSAPVLERVAVAVAA